MYLAHPAPNHCPSFASSRLRAVRHNPSVYFGVARWPSLRPRSHLTFLLPNLLLKRPNVAFYPLNRTLERVDVLGEQLVADAVLVDNVVVHSRAGGRGTKQEAEESKK